MINLKQFVAAAGTLIFFSNTVPIANAEQVYPVLVSSKSHKSNSLSNESHQILKQGIWLDVNCYKETINPRDIRILAATMSAEARSGGIEAMANAGETMVNRACDGRYGGYKIEGVVKMDWQFSVYNKDSNIKQDLYNYEANGMVANRDFEWHADKALPIAEALLLGWRTGNLNEKVLHYANLDHCSPVWAEGITPLHVDAANHSFFQGIR